MTVDVIEGALDYITNHVDMSGKVYIIDIGRDVIHEDPILLTTWEQETQPEDGCFVDAAFPPEYLALEFSPDENIRVAYDHGISVKVDEYRGEYTGVKFYSVDERLQHTFREANDESYSPAESLRQTLYSVLQ